MIQIERIKDGRAQGRSVTLAHTQKAWFAGQTKRDLNRFSMGSDVSPSPSVWIRNDNALTSHRRGIHDTAAIISKTGQLGISRVQYIRGNCQHTKT